MVISLVIDLKFKQAQKSTHSTLSPECKTLAQILHCLVLRRLCRMFPAESRQWPSRLSQPFGCRGRKSAWKFLSNFDLIILFLLRYPSKFFSLFFIPERPQSFKVNTPSTRPRGR